MFSTEKLLNNGCLIRKIKMKTILKKNARKIMRILKNGKLTNASYIERTQGLSYWTVIHFLEKMHKKGELKKMQTIIGTDYYIMVDKKKKCEKNKKRKHEKLL